MVTTRDLKKPRADYWEKKSFKPNTRKKPQGVHNKFVRDIDQDWLRLLSLLLHMCCLLTSISSHYFFFCFGFVFIFCFYFTFSHKLYLLLLTTLQKSLCDLDYSRQIHLEIVSAPLRGNPRSGAPTISDFTPTQF